MFHQNDHLTSPYMFYSVIVAIDTAVGKFRDQKTPKNRSFVVESASGVHRTEQWGPENFHSYVLPQVRIIRY